VIRPARSPAVAVAFAKFLAVLVPALGSAALIDRDGFALSAQQLVAVADDRRAHRRESPRPRDRKADPERLHRRQGRRARRGGRPRLAFGSRSDVLATNFAAPFATTHARGFIAASFGAAMVGALFSADAWNNVTFTAAEVRDPRRALPRALWIGTGLVVLLYFLTNVAISRSLP
jgi:APA family basic amino acid/polyamine antiporter